MSTWGGIGEGLAAGMNRRIDIELQERERRRQQANADRQFEFQQEQAQRAQANADRQFAEGQRTSDRDYALRESIAKTEEDIKRTDQQLKSDLAALDYQMKGEELEDRRINRQHQREMNDANLTIRREELAGQREDRAMRREMQKDELAGKKEDRALRREDSADNRALREREIELQESKAQDDTRFRNRQQTQVEINADRDYMLRKDAQDWQNRLNSEKVESFKLQNQQLMDAWNKQKEKEDLIRRTGRNQLAQGIYTMQSNGDQFEEGTIQLDGKETKVRVMPPEMRDQIFGSEGPLSDIANMFIIDTDEGRKIGFQRNGPNGPTTVLYGDGEQYDILRSGIDKDFADGAMSAYVGKRDVGLKIAEAEGKAMATAKATLASDPYGRKRSTDAAVAILRSDDASDAQRERALETLEANLKRDNADDEKVRRAKIEAEAKRRGLVFNKKTGRWEKKAK